MPINGLGHKKTMSCPLEKCNYTSRTFVKSPFFSDKDKKHFSNESKHCPFHQKELIYKIK